MQFLLATSFRCSEHVAKLVLIANRSNTEPNTTMKLKLIMLHPDWLMFKRTVDDVYFIIW